MALSATLHLTCCIKQVKKSIFQALCIFMCLTLTLSSTNGTWIINSSTDLNSAAMLLISHGLSHKAYCSICSFENQVMSDLQRFLFFHKGWLPWGPLIWTQHLFAYRPLESCSMFASKGEHRKGQILSLPYLRCFCFASVFHFVEREKGLGAQS